MSLQPLLVSPLPFRLALARSFLCPSRFRQASLQYFFLLLSEVKGSPQRRRAHFFVLAAMMAMMLKESPSPKYLLLINYLLLCRANVLPGGTVVKRKTRTIFPLLSTVPFGQLPGSFLHRSRRPG